ncbi:2Fe-2S iron-sulfur cluster-binding protein [Thalassorhabdomicrobium marinisediminis]|uniref:2Fe-2S ferredoxin-type domain-containing protein n=1 Tax=Thalassorhabdomicrobium marinisediminis TaxID=2170577 RepID=A0A2T7FZC7_9RHOB|nr:2Fe-2S iron-sulfur cluster-binding protein [Thalassorhabdomicrobium marinisediminis]PVA07527.1 hypothetical protein DC363_02520 [Thalassorhabdomicrobium marinisediminis]
MTKITFIEADGTTVEAKAEPGMSVMQVAVNAGIAAIAAECGGACACGTCHCYVADEWVDKLTPPEDDETDMLDFVIDPTPSSRLSCQIAVTPEMDGLVINVPSSQT